MQQPGVTTTTAIPEKTASVSDNTITIKDFAFNPPAMTVRAGATVRWVNADSATHRIQARGDIISPLLSSGQSWSRIFDQAGTYEYTCTIHPSMHGTLVVE
jgi:plastocyanin